MSGQESEAELEEKLSDLEFDLDDDLTEEERKDIIETYQPEIDEIKESKRRVGGNLNTNKIVIQYRLVGSLASLLQKGEKHHV